MTKTFRVGDVVRFQDRVEYTIQTIGSGTVEGYAAVNGGRWVAMFECVLMRRSVHVGDVLRTPFGGMWTATTRDLSVSDYLQCTHADGTAIEPARIACSECHQPIGEAAFTSVGVPGKQCSEECHFCAAYMRGLEELRVIAGEATFAAAPAGEAAKAPAAHAEPYTLVFGDAGGWRRSVDTPTIARALFETDANVMAHVKLRGETEMFHINVPGHSTAWFPPVAAYADTMQRCWDRGFAGESPEWRWYVRAVDRAKLMGGVK